MSGRLLMEWRVFREVKAEMEKQALQRPEDPKGR